MSKLNFFLINQTSKMNTVSQCAEYVLPGSKFLILTFKQVPS